MHVSACGVAIPALLAGSPLWEWPANHKMCSYEREGWHREAVLLKPERHFPIGDVSASLGQAALAQPILFSSCKLPVRASHERGNKGLFKLHRSCPLKLSRLFPCPAIQDSRVRSAKLCGPLPPLFSKGAEPLP